MSSPSEAFTYVSLFAGCGGSSLGYHMAGGRCLCAVEFDANAAATYRLNFPDVPVIEQDIRQVTAEEVLQTAGLIPGQLDVLDGSPPCQGFSTAGKRQFGDPRNSLFRDYIRLLEALQPKAFVMENVSGLVKGKMKLAFRTIMESLKATGYRVRCKLLNAMWFGVPQSRQRLIWIGVRPDLGQEAEWPKSEEKLVTVREALDGCNVGLTLPLSAVYANVWRKVPVGGDEADTNGGIKGFNNVAKVAPDLPCRTLPKTNSGNGYATLCRWDVPRGLGIGEAKRLSSYPDDFRLVGSFSEQWARIGNSVPP